MEEFPPTFLNDTNDRKYLTAKVKEKGIESVLVVSLIKKETDSRYIPGTCLYRPYKYYYYGRLWDYYNYWYPCVYNPGYYITDEIYYIDINLYNSASEELVWSAQSTTYNPSSLTEFSKEFALRIVAQLKGDGVIASTD